MGKLRASGEQAPCGEPCQQARKFRDVVGSNKTRG